MKSEYQVLDYVDSVHPTSGIIYNVTDDRDSWIGYQVHLRPQLSKYRSVKECKDREPYLRTFILRDYGIGSFDVVDARLMCHKFETVKEYEIFERMNLVMVRFEYDSLTNPQLLIDAINMMLKQDNEEIIYASEEQLKQIRESSRYQELFDEDDE